MLAYRLAVLYRLILVLLCGYACTALISVTLPHVLSLQLEKPDAVYLSAILSIVFYLCFFIIGFCINSLKKLSLYSFLLGLCLYTLYVLMD